MGTESTITNSELCCFCVVFTRVFFSSLQKKYAFERFVAKKTLNKAGKGVYFFEGNKGTRLIRKMRKSRQFRVKILVFLSRMQSWTRIGTLEYPKSQILRRGAGLPSSSVFSNFKSRWQICCKLKQICSHTHQHQDFLRFVFLKNCYYHFVAILTMKWQ